MGALGDSLRGPSTRSRAVANFSAVRSVSRAFGTRFTLIDRRNDRRNLPAGIPPGIGRILAVWVWQHVRGQIARIASPDLEP